ncbi:MAG: glycoside hydrolase family 3 C-terminal domain-containing protein [Tannerellaceae bacterium]|jgi:beta-glucosidase|nr:glycoside hydrolase family 3 C-terminal domain-containing protein [Tannerellaceae bacterium]
MKLSLFFISCLLLFCQACTSKSGYEHPFRDPDLSVEERVNDLVSRLTVEEKISQMLNNAPAIERLGIPAYNWWNEALHGVARSPYPVTSYPQAIGIAATWNEAAVHLMADYISTEGRAIYNDASRKGNVGIFTGLTYWSPNINIFRDPRWGRGQETYGEDPYLTARIGSAFVKGIQGDDPHYLKASACAKHFAVHSGPEWNRHTYNAQVTVHDLRDTYLPAFRELIMEAKVTGVMCAYNAFFGQPCCGSDTLMMEILRKEWGFDGYVTSDCGAIDDFYRTHKTHANASSSAADAVLHGTDCECGNSTYKALAEAIESGLITEAQIDISLKRLFSIRFRLGMFDPEERVPYSRISLSELEAPAHKSHALDMARQSVVLLKNENNLLPLNKGKIRKIAVVGPNADSKSVLLANYYGYPSKVITLLDGIKSKAPEAEIIYDKGVNLTDDYVFVSALRDELFTFDNRQGFNATYYTNLKMEGEPVLTRHEPKLDYQWGDGQEIAEGLIARQMSAIWSTVFTADESGEVCFEIKADDWAELYIDGKKQDKIGNINAYYPLTAEKNRQYKLDIHYRQHADNAEIALDYGRLKRTSPKDVANRVKEADIIIFAGGISSKVEGEEMGVQIDGFKQGDRTSIELPSVQKALLRELAGTGKPIVFVLMTGSAIGLEWESQNIPAIVNAWYGGQAGGQAVADILFGDYNPAGRLPVTFYRSTADLPDFEDYSMENRTYRYFSGSPIYPFGYGLSYTTFQYDQLAIEIHDGGQSVNVSAIVKNTGVKDGDEVVQLYVAGQSGSPAPIRSLRGFKRINIKAGESIPVTFHLTADDLSLIDELGRSKLMHGPVEIAVGGGQPSSALLSSQQCVRTEITLGNDDI